MDEWAEHHQNQMKRDMNYQKTTKIPTLKMKNALPKSNLNLNFQRQMLFIAVWFASTVILSASRVRSNYTPTLNGLFKYSGCTQSINNIHETQKTFRISIVCRFTHWQVRGLVDTNDSEINKN